MIYINDFIMKLYQKNPEQFDSIKYWIVIVAVIIVVLTGFFDLVFPLLIFIHYYLGYITEHTKQSLIGMGIFFIWFLYDLVNVLLYGY